MSTTSFLKRTIYLVLPLAILAICFAQAQQSVPTAFDKSKGLIGVVMVDLKDSISKQNKIPATVKGAFVQNIVKGTPAEEAGIQTGDVVTKLNKKTITSLKDFLDERGKYGVGQEMTLVIWRGGKTLTKKLKIRPVPEQPTVK